jgi:hypothetical protein
LQHQASNSKKVALKSVTLKSTGTYRCEISAEEPDFKTVSGEQKLEVICEYFSFIRSFTQLFHNCSSDQERRGERERDEEAGGGGIYFLNWSGIIARNSN